MYKVLEHINFHERTERGWEEVYFQRVSQDGRPLIEKYYPGYGYQPTSEESSWEAVLERAGRAYHAWYEYSRPELEALRDELRQTAEERDELRTENKEYARVLRKMAARGELVA
jgi:hypothetical protein